MQTESESNSESFVRRHPGTDAAVDSTGVSIDRGVSFSIRTHTVVFDDDAQTEENESDSDDELFVASSRGEKPRKSPMTDKYTYREHLFILCLAMILSFNSGFSNGICLSGFITPDSATWDRQSTSGFTGAYTTSALALVDTDQEILVTPNIQYFGRQICMILSFIAGSAISAILNPRPAPWRLAPMYAITFFIGAIFMCIAAVLSSVELEGRTHFYFFVAAANGVQNGISSMYSANLIRTTHLTGTSTDIGLFVGQYLRGNRKNTWKLEILIGLAFSFWIGGICSFFAVQAWTKYALLFNAGIFFFLFALIVFFIVQNLHMSLGRAIQGTWHWQRTMHRLSFRSGNCGTPKSHNFLQDVFDQMDEDGDGVIDAESLYKGLHGAGLESSMTKQQVDVMFEVCDKDKDGKIGFQEFKNLVLGDNVLVG